MVARRHLKDPAEVVATEIEEENAAVVGECPITVGMRFNYLTRIILSALVPASLVAVVRTAALESLIRTVVREATASRPEERARALAAPFVVHAVKLVEVS